MDIHTLAIISVLLSLSLGGGLFLCYRFMFHGEVKGVNYFSFSFTLMGASIIPICFGFHSSYWAYVLYSNVIYLLSICALVLGVIQLRDYSGVSGKRFALAVTLSSCLLIGYFILIEPSLTGRVAVRSGFTALMCFIAVYINVTSVKKDSRTPVMILAAVLSVHGMYMMVRVGFTLSEESSLAYFDLSFLHKMVYLMIIMVVISISFAVFWILTERLIAKLHQSSVFDQLTNLYNRNGLEELREKWRKSARIKTSTMSVIIADLDHFKRVNDTFGHDYGDLVLSSFSKVLKSQCRDRDYCIRYGGEEFLVVLPDTELDRAIVVAERIRSAIEHHFSGEQDLKKHITASFGVAESNENESWESLLKKADLALYDAKNSGRNRVCCVSLGYQNYAEIR
ncbi:GGDEF domain-containing protein [Vibrio tapetis subsp. quintayensis]|uniref:GGDEF domain-containing protein n=1 Tax=Vibrio tapetis TaxID=52443 RepID=UPI0025B61E46|nr:GGDEF domain-containing protein [Vibrio tapetis]MDN3680977.1 GGDEF domain-containing protein [Vibrio tapetis subsp. quintayensis]